MTSNSMTLKKYQSVISKKSPTVLERIRLKTIKKIIRFVESIKGF